MSENLRSKISGLGRATAAFVCFAGFTGTLLECAYLVSARNRDVGWQGYVALVLIATLFMLAPKMSDIVSLTVSGTKIEAVLRDANAVVVEGKATIDLLKSLALSQSITLIETLGSSILGNPAEQQSYAIRKRRILGSLQELGLDADDLKTVEDADARWCRIFYVQPVINFAAGYSPKPLEFQSQLMDGRFLVTSWFDTRKETVSADEIEATFPGAFDEPAGRAAMEDFRAFTERGIHRRKATAPSLYRNVAKD